MRLPVQLQKRDPDVHKGDFGHVLVIGGSPGLTGAVCLCAEAALRIGAGLVTVGVPSSLHSIFEIKLTEVMSIALADDMHGRLILKAYRAIREFSKKITVLAIGCGAGRGNTTQKLLRKVVLTRMCPVVVDADGLNAFENKMKGFGGQKNPLIFTPHLGEFARLTKKSVAVVKSQRKKLAKEFASRYNLTLVLKGYNTFVTDGNRSYENITGSPGMATAGSGDVLTGFISGLLAQKVEPFSAACVGTYLHGLAGELAAREKTECAMIASDIIAKIPDAFLQAKNGCDDLLPR